MVLDACAQRVEFALNGCGRLGNVYARMIRSTYEREALAGLGLDWLGSKHCVILNELFEVGNSNG